MANISEVLRKAREDANKSQAYVAGKLGVTKTTVQNWETGYSAPDCNKCIEWFKVIDRPILPYILPVLYPAIDIDAATDSAIQDALIECIKCCSAEQQRKLLFLFYGSHGSSPEGLLEMLTAHLHVPLRSRLNVCSSIITNYEVSEGLGELVEEGQFRPNMEVLKASLEAAKIAVKENKKGY